jgi:uncharacterized protein YfeS
VISTNVPAASTETWCIFAHRSPSSMGGGAARLASILMDEPGRFSTGLAQLALEFVQLGNYVPSHANGQVVLDGSIFGQRERWESYVASLPIREFKRKHGRLAFQVRGYPQLDFRDDIYMNNITRDDMRIAANMVLSGLTYALSTLKQSDGVNLTSVIAAAEQLAVREWATDNDLRENLAAAYALDRTRIEAMDPWSTVDFSTSHRNARNILDLPSDWSQIDDFAPHGNDLGADILGNWSDVRGQSVEKVARHFEIDLVSDSDRASLDRIQLTLGLAFSYIKKSGKCPIDLATAALNTLNAERHRAIQAVAPAHKASFNAAYDRYAAILDRVSKTNA